MLYTEADTTAYDNFPAALKAANKVDSARMVLQGDVSFGGKAGAQTARTNLTIDLNGHSLGDTLSSTTLLRLDADTLQLTVLSSRPGGRLWAVRAYNGRIYAISITRGKLRMEGVKVDCRNLMPWDELTAKSVAASGINCSKTAGGASLSDCQVSVACSGAVTGIGMYSSAEVTRCRVKVQAGKVTSYGIYVGEGADCSVRSGHCDVHGGKAVYGLYGKGVTRCERDTFIVKTDSANVYGVYAADTLSLLSCRISSESAFKGAYGLYCATEETLCTLRDCDITSLAGTTHCYGVYLGKGALWAEESRIWSKSRMDTCTKEADPYTRGVHGSKNTKVRMQACTVRSESTHAQYAKYVYGLLLSGQSEVTDCVLEARSAYRYAYGVYTTDTTSFTQIKDCRIQAFAPSDYGPVRKNTAMKGRLFFSGGYYTDDTNLRDYMPDTCSLYRLWDHEAAYAQGYRFTIQPIAEPMAITACVYAAQGNKTPVGKYYHLSDALAYVNKYPEKRLTIVQVGSYILPAGAYTIPKNAALVVPYTFDQTTATGTNMPCATSPKAAQEFVRLVMAKGTTLTVQGVLETTAAVYPGGGCSNAVSGTYGHIHTQDSVQVTVENGGRINAWGYITGKGKVEAMPGAEIHEVVQLGDWKGARVVFPMIDNPQKVCPFTHFFYQNIEVPVIYHTGAKAFGMSQILASDMTIPCPDIMLIADSAALFVTRDSTGNGTICKAYDPLTDRIQWTVNGDALLDELSLKLNSLSGNFSMYSSKYVLPLGSNMTVRAESGQLTIMHDAMMIPGSVLDITEGTELRIPEGVRFFLYDTLQWGAYNDHAFYTVSYSPSWKTCPRDSMLQSARLIVNGRLEVEGSLLTTEGGADIMGSEQAEGEIRFARGACAKSMVYQLTGTTDEHGYTPSTAVSAMLRNADGTYTETTDARAGDSFVYSSGRWANTRTPDEEALPALPSGRVSCTKRLQNGVLFIERNGRLFTLTGTAVH
jgi:hypothetical protein